MTAVKILAETTADGRRFRAISSGRESVGHSAGEALDLLTAQMSQTEGGTLVGIQTFTPDAYFSDVERTRLASLMALWRDARDRGAAISEEDQAELERLIELEQESAHRRADALRRTVGQ